MINLNETANNYCKYFIKKLTKNAHLNFKRVELDKVVFDVHCVLYKGYYINVIGEQL